MLSLLIVLPSVPKKKTISSFRFHVGISFDSRVCFEFYSYVFMQPCLYCVHIYISFDLICRESFSSHLFLWFNGATYYITLHYMLYDIYVLYFIHWRMGKRIKMNSNVFVESVICSLPSRPTFISSPLHLDYIWMPTEAVENSFYIRKNTSPVQRSK